MTYLIVAAHPDDEVLGAGATIHKLAKQGHEVYVCMMSHWSPTRDDNLEDGIKESHRISSCVLHPPGSHSFSWSF